MRLDQLPDCLQSRVLSYAAPERTARVKSLRTSTDSARVVWELPQIENAPQGSLIDRVKLGVPDIYEPAEYVKRVKRAAVQLLQQDRNHLFPNDYEEMGKKRETPLVEYSYTEMNEASDRMDRNLQDEALIEFMDRVFQMVPILGAVVQLPDYSLFEHPIEARASRIRTFLNNPDNQVALGLVIEINADDLPWVPPEILRFPNLQLMPFLNLAIENGEREMVQAILNDPRELPEFELDTLFHQAIIYSPEVVELFIQGVHPLSPIEVGIALSVSALHKHWDLVQLIFNSGRPIDIGGAQLGEILIRAVKEKQRDVVRLCLAFPTQIGSLTLIQALKKAFKNQDWRTAWAILQSNHPIFPHLIEELSLDLFENNHWNALHLILRSRHPLSSLTVGRILNRALQSGLEETVRDVLNSNRPLDPTEASFALGTAVIKKNRNAMVRLLQEPIESDWMLFAVRTAVSLSNPEAARLLLNSGHEIPQQMREEALAFLQKDESK